MEQKKKNILLIIIAAVAIIASGIYLCFFIIGKSAFLWRKPPDAPELSTEISVDNLGSAKALSGNVGVVTIFADDTDTQWDFDNEKDKQTATTLLQYMDIAYDWLTAKAQDYGVNVNFIYPEKPDGDMFYRASFNEQLPEVDKSIKKSTPAEWQYIDSSIDSQALKAKYNLDNIIYLFFVNYSEDAPAKNAPFALGVYNQPLEYDYELCIVPAYYLGLFSAPAVIAHETLHLFGAPDWYAYDYYNNNYRTTMDTVSWFKDKYPDDIMVTTKKTIDGEIIQLKDRIEATISPLTAYYIGWSDEAATQAQELSLLNSQHYPVFEYKPGFTYDGDRSYGIAIESD